MKLRVGGESDPFAEVKINKFVKQTIRTKTIDDNCYPVWDHEDNFTIDIKESESKGLSLLFTVYDYDIDSNDFLGNYDISLDDYFDNPGKWYNSVE